MPPACCSGVRDAFCWVFGHRQPPHLHRSFEDEVLKVIIRQQDTVALQDYIEALQLSASGKLVEALQAAVRQGNPDAVSSSQSPCLHEALLCGASKVVDDLLKAGAHPEATNGAGETALEVAATSKVSNSVLFSLRKAHDKKRQTVFNEDLHWIPKVPLFSRLQPSEYPRLAAAFTSRKYAEGETVVREGEVGHELYIIQSGSVKVSQASQELAILGPGAHFGEVALLTDEPRNATVVAAEELSVKRLTRAEFESLELKRKLKKREAIRQGDLQRRKTDPQLAMLRQKTADEAQLIRDTMMGNQHLGPLLKAMNDSALEEIIFKAFRTEVKTGENVVTQGELRADLFYIVQEGTFDIIKDGECVARFKPGMSFGELALLYREPRAATVRAASPGRLWAVARQDLRAVMQAPLRKKLERWADMLDTVAVLKEVPSEDKRSLADALVETTFYENEYIIRQGEVGDTFYVIENGEVAIEVNGTQVAKLSAKADSASSSSSSIASFGERSLLEDEPRSASVRALSKKVVVLALHRGIFTMVMKPIASTCTINSYSMDDMITYSMDKLQKLGVLGYGGFGVVSLVKCNLTNRHFALKAISKGHIVQQQQEKSVMNEKTILRMTSSPFLVRLAATFNGRHHLYFLMEPALGGELFTIYQRRKEFYGSQLHSRFYIACILLALEHLHERQVVYRDLKPENVLLDNRGYAKVTDFGLAKFVVGHTYTTCGTPDYFAPEMVVGCGHTVAVDWWTLGVMTYELMISDAPFSADNPMSVLKKVKRGMEHAHFPSKSASWAKLVLELCRQEPSERLPMRKGGVGNVKQSLWYKEVAFNWDSLVKREMAPPFVPKVGSDADTSNFETFEEHEGPPQLPYRDTGSKWDEAFQEPRGPRLD